MKPSFPALPAEFIPDRWGPRYGIGTPIYIGPGPHNQYLRWFIRLGCWEIDSRVRNLLVKRFAWAVPSEPALQRLELLGPILELGAGTGYWAHLLRQRGVDILAYDRNPSSGPAPGHYALTGQEQGRFWTEVLEGGAEKAAEHPERTLLLCWPPYDPDHEYEWDHEAFEAADNLEVLEERVQAYAAAMERKPADRDGKTLAIDALEHYWRAGGNTVVYIGELSGCTAGPHFEALLYAQYRETDETVRIPQHGGIYDELHVFRRKPVDEVTVERYPIGEYGVEIPEEA